MELEAWIERVWDDLKADAPMLAIRNEADLKCHLFSRLHASKIASNIEIHSEVNFPLDSRNSRVRVDLVVAIDSHVEAAIELKYRDYPRFEKDYRNLRRLSDAVAVNDCISNARFSSSKGHSEPLKLSSSSRFYYGSACAKDASSASDGGIAERIGEQPKIKNLPAIVFSEVK
jgi:hypothetical protein